MKAIIMAGGEGSRLRPLTCDCPKPMVPLMDKPVMSYAVELLKRHGVTETAATLQYLPDRIQDYFGDGSDFGVFPCAITSKKNRSALPEACGRPRISSQKPLWCSPETA